MPVYGSSADDLLYASGSSWTSGKARQGVYSKTRYEGAIVFPQFNTLQFNNISISQIQLTVTFGASGGCSHKYLTFYKATQNAVSGSIAAMRGDSIGACSIEDAYDRTVTLTFSASSESAMFTTLRDYFISGGRTLIIYVPTTRGTYSKGFCYDYLSVTAASISFTYEYLRSEGTMQSSSVAAGSSARLNIKAYNSGYSHKVKWTFGSNSTTQTVATGTAYASYTIPLSWLSAIPSATSGSATVSLETLDGSGKSLGSYSYSFTITAPSSVVPTIGSVTATPVNSNSVIAGWNIYVYGKTKATLKINSAAGVYGSTIKSYSITTSTDVGSSTASSFTTSTLSKTGTITVTGKVTDSRGRTATKTTTFYVYPYSAPAISSVTSYRCLSNGTRDDSNGTYAYLKASFGCSALSGSNKVTAQATLTQIGGSYSTSTSLTSGTAVILGGGNLAIDAAYKLVIALTDTVGTKTTYETTVSSVAYVMHAKKGGKAVGFGTAAGADNTATFGWKVRMNTPLEISQGGTSADTAYEACKHLGAVKTMGDTMTGDLRITGTYYPALHLSSTTEDSNGITVVSNLLAAERTSARGRRRTV